MTLKEAYGLVRSRCDATYDVEIQRSGATWVGKVVGVMDQPCVIVEREDGSRAVIALDGATAFLETEKRGA